MAPWQIDFIQGKKLSARYIQDAEPIALWLFEQLESSKIPFCFGINGAQGSGKSTLAAYLVAYLNAHGYRADNVSLDDFYLSSQARQTCADKYHPLLSTRGVPGTHDVRLLKQVLNEFKLQYGVTLPRFNKVTDNPYDETKWLHHKVALDVLIIEGWCLGLKPEPRIRLQYAVNDWERIVDSDRVFRDQVNQFLSDEYQSAFTYLDKLIYLDIECFKRVFAWRWQQERQLIANNGKGMDKQQVYDFIKYFQRLTEWGFECLPHQCDLHIKVDKQHRFYVNAF
ncbi:hypothetical protein PSECIP111854_00591 [Pseudoalteromonas sp. CIP111854]|uniref:Kinase n=1 Tax=Pseudoalteromonas holothuriae TaxID=2963714 RepID=A0A9W4QSF6_9GAMM|nr:kinase [Pseudoalteromonas sp. CIP111854]CAH9050739.1 hypothetical protein PSECIP111854_00591 [Pseudoalteromonas sp. CIP111854]